VGKKVIWNRKNNKEFCRAELESSVNLCRTSRASQEWEEDIFTDTETQVKSSFFHPTPRPQNSNDELFIFFQLSHFPDGKFDLYFDSHFKTNLPLPKFSNLNFVDNSG